VNQNVNFLLARYKDEDSAVRQRAMNLADFPESLVDVFGLTDRGASVKMRLNVELSRLHFDDRRRSFEKSAIFSEIFDAKSGRHNNQLQWVLRRRVPFPHNSENIDNLLRLGLGWLSKTRIKDDPHFNI
jgi:hypothetical protein